MLMLTTILRCFQKSFLSSNQLILVVLCTISPLVLDAQTTQQKLDSLMRQVPFAETQKITLVYEIHGLLAGLPRAEQVVKCRRMLYFMDSLARSGTPITAAGLYIKARMQKDIMLYMQSDALQTTVEAAEIAEKNNDKPLLLLCYAQESHINSTIENYHEAVRLGNKAIALIDEIDPGLLAKHDWAEGIASIYNGVGVSYDQLGQYDSALAKFNAGENFARKFNEPLWVSLIRSSRSNIYIKTGRAEDALLLTREFYQYGKLVHDWRVVGGSALAISNLYLLKKDYVTSRLYLDSASLALGHSPDHEDELRINYLRQLARLEEAQGNYHAAFVALEKFNSGYQELKRKQQAAMVTNIQASYDFDKNQRAIENLTYENGRQRIFFTASIIVLVLVIILAVYFIYSFRLQRKTTRVISVQRDDLASAHSQLNVAYENLQLAQDSLVKTEKMAVLGRLTSGIAHEVNTPLGAVKASSENINRSFTMVQEGIQEFAMKIPPTYVNKVLYLFTQIKTLPSGLSFAQRREMKRRCIDVLQDLGVKKAETIAEHLLEMGITDNYEKWKDVLLLPDALPIFEYLSEVSLIKGQNENIGLAVNKAGKILFALKVYSHSANSEVDQVIRVSENIETVLSLYSGNFSAIEVDRFYESVPAIKGNPDELSQVWTNLIYNAIQAMGGKGKLTITIKMHALNEVKVEISDTGHGISVENQKHLFEPFFTTKQAGEGTGLGLSIVQKIVEKHHGRIEAESEQGKGALFRVILPGDN